MVEERATGSGICIYNASFFFSLGILLGQTIGLHILALYVPLTHMLFEPDGGKIQARGAWK